MEVSKDKWLLAQAEERKFHMMGRAEGMQHYFDTYKQYQKFLGMSWDVENKEIAEVGPADFPMLAFCENIRTSFVVEPMPSVILKTMGVSIITNVAEEVDFSTCDEVWLMNVLQHTVDPDKIVQNAKQAKMVRFFEPVNYGVDECHLHNLTMEMFYDWFGKDVVKYYPKNNAAVNFHTWECAYGVWER